MISRVRATGNDLGKRLFLEHVHFKSSNVKAIKKAPADTVDEGQQRIDYSLARLDV